MNVSGWDAADILAKALGYLTVLGTAGAVFFQVYARDLLDPEERVLIGRGLLGSALASVVLALLRVAITAGNLTGELRGMVDGSMLRMVWQSGAQYGLTMQGAGVALILMDGALADAALRRGWRWRPGVGMCVGAVLMATSPVCSGHVSDLHPARLPRAILGVHLLGASFWIGALMPLVLVTRRGDGARVAQVARRFSAFAQFVVPCLLIAGCYLACRLLGDVAQLWSTAYGRRLICKLLCVALLLALAALNRWRLTPRLAASAEARQAFMRSLRVEIIVAAALLTVTAALTTLSGPEVAGEP